MIRKYISRMSIILTLATAIGYTGNLEKSFEPNTQNAIGIERKFNEGVKRLPPVDKTEDLPPAPDPEAAMRELYPELKRIIGKPEELFDLGLATVLPPSRKIPKIFPPSRFEYFTGWDLASKPEDHILVAQDPGYFNEQIVRSGRGCYIPQMTPKVTITGVRPVITDEPGRLPNNPYIRPLSNSQGN